MNAGTRVDHNQFCLNEEWVLVRDAYGRPVRHQVTYELALNDGNILRTRVSRPADKTAYGPSLWKTILRDQLWVTEDEFWVCVRGKKLPDRGQSADETPEASLPAGLVYQLIHVVLVPEDEVKNLTLEQALAVMNEHWGKSQTE